MFTGCFTGRRVRPLNDCAGLAERGRRRRNDAQSVVMPDDSPAAELAQRLAKPLNKLLPPSATEAKKLQKQLMHAGFRSAEAPIIYRAIQLASMAGFPLLVAGVCAVTGATAEQCADLHHHRFCRRVSSCRVFS